MSHEFPQVQELVEKHGALFASALTLSEKIMNIGAVVGKKEIENKEVDYHATYLHPTEVKAFLEELKKIPQREIKKTTDILLKDLSKRSNPGVHTSLIKISHDHNSQEPKVIQVTTVFTENHAAYQNNINVCLRSKSHLGNSDQLTILKGIHKLLDEEANIYTHQPILDGLSAVLEKRNQILNYYSQQE